MILIETFYTVISKLEMWGQKINFDPTFRFNRPKLGVKYLNRNSFSLTISDVYLA